METAATVLLWMIVGGIGLGVLLFLTVIVIALWRDQ